jgi:acyl carrier protein
MKDKPNMAVDSETSFFATNILDSLDFLNLVEYLQEQYGIEIDDDEMSPDNFENAAAVAALVTQLKA